uniref:Uncharacterized protein n=1 Tax=Anguilla anguilla TaxID=7936 RepID=A0A0E9WMZ6_ANGAN
MLFMKLYLWIEMNHDPKTMIQTEPWTCEPLHPVTHFTHIWDTLNERKTTRRTNPF